MILKLLGLADLLALIALFLTTLLPQSIIIVMALYLIIKGVFFAIMGDMVSLIDVFTGIYLASASYGMSHWSITLILTIIILQKAIVSIFS